MSEPRSIHHEQAMTFELGKYQAAVDAALLEVAAQDVVARIWQRDFTVWQPAPTEITNRLGWLDSPLEMAAQVDRLTLFADEVRSAGLTHVLLLGMGGSSLAPEVFGQVFGDLDEAGMSLTVLDSTDPGAVSSAVAGLVPEKTLFIVSTKSGGTVETLSFFKHCYNWVVGALGSEKAGAHFVAITDPGSKLQQLAERYHFRAVLLNNPDIGGRYSVLSHFGLLPAALVGLDVERLLASALAVRARCTAGGSLDENPGAYLGVVLGELARLGRDKVTLLISTPVASIGYWVEQLVAESTGKSGVGILPVEGEPIGAPDVYGCDRLFVQLKLDGDASNDAAVRTLVAAGHPVIQLVLADRYDLGGQFFLWEFATAVAGQRLAINPFDQPNVEAAKRVARQMVSAYQSTGVLPDSEPATLSRQTLDEFLALAHSGDPVTGQGRSYVALQAYLQPTAEARDALQALRTQIRDRYQLATTLGYGPRFLHSTGQLHKGDAGAGLFVQFTVDDAHDVPIPDQAGEPGSTISFGVLKAAQASGDRQALLDAGRRVIRFHLGSDPVAGLTLLTGT